jgi:alkylation response protein AidB-like acyl-CoA dehydrogenase
MLERSRDRIQPPADCIERARALAPMIAAAVPRIEREGVIVPEIIAAMHDARLFRLLIPRAYGGEELEPIWYVQAVEEIAKADASTAWCMAQASGSSLAAGYLVPAVAHDVFGAADAVVASGPPGTSSRAIAVEGGYRLTGSWPFASGIGHATWLGAHCTVCEADGTPRAGSDGRLIERTMLFPKARATITKSWDVLGLRGTGSHAYAVDDLFVPEAYSFTRDAVPERREPGPLYRFSILNMFGFGFAAVALGIARAMLDAFVQLAAAKAPHGSTRRLCEDPVVQHEMGRAEARLRAARAYLLTTLQEAWDVAVVDGLTSRQSTLMRLASTHVIHEAGAVVGMAYHAAGSTAIFQAQAFERRFRDMNTVSQQLQARASHFQLAGQYLLQPAT